MHNYNVNIRLFGMDVREVVGVSLEVKEKQSRLPFS